MNEPVGGNLEVELRRAKDVWRVVVVRDGHHHEFASIEEAIRYLKRIRGATHHPTRGLR